MKRQIIYLIGENNQYTHKQVDEITKLFKRYDISVIANVTAGNQEEISSLLENKTEENIEILAALNIQNNLKLTSERQSKALHSALDECMVHSYRLENSELIYKQFYYATEGYVTELLSYLTPHSESFYEQFILKNVALTYSELEYHNMKHTSQSLAVSKFICDEIYYPEPINLNFNHQKQSGTIDFRNDPANFLQDNIYFNNSFAAQYGITNLFHTVLNQGVFFRSPKNRREKNYWCPALNAGLPLTPKRDVIHEMTYIAHDFGHFLIPDLLYTGNHSAKNQQIYITYRMMSEAFTLVLADMIFVDSLSRSGFEYDYSKRKIYPLFQEFEIDLTKPDNYLDNIKKMLRASVDFCLKGDDRGLSRLSSRKQYSSTNLEHFKEKYMKFFCEDFKWTKHNYNWFRSNSQEFKKWWVLVRPLRNKAQLEIESIEEFSLRINAQSDDLVSEIFNVLFQRVSKILLNKTASIDKFEKRQLKAFFKYIMGQLLLLIRFENLVKEAKIFQKIIINYLNNIKDEIQIKDIDFCRNILSSFVDLLLERNLINYDDAHTFKEVFPIFEPCFAFYDEKIDFYKDLSLVAYESIYAA